MIVVILIRGIILKTIRPNLFIVYFDYNFIPPIKKFIWGVIAQYNGRTCKFDFVFFQRLLKQFGVVIYLGRIGVPAVFNRCKISFF